MCMMLNSKININLSIQLKNTSVSALVTTKFCTYKL